MADQIVDKRTVGIPPDILDVREDVEARATEAEAAAVTAQGYSRSAAMSAEAADASESAAATYAAQSAAWAVVRNQGLHFGEEEPPTKIDGMLWIKTDESVGTIVAFERWDAASAGAGLFPSEATWPSEDTWPEDQGDWKSFKVASAALA